MAVNQAQVDHIITAASEDDPEVKLQNLEREVDLIKTSIKRLLMDIRERMNEMENPFTISSMSGSTDSEKSSDSTNAAKKAALDAKEAALEARESTLDAAKAKQEAEARDSAVKPSEPETKPIAAPGVSPVAASLPFVEERHVPDEQMISLLKSQLITSGNKPGPNTLASEKLRLQKVYKLFKWTNAAIRKFGHDRLDIILESYRIMGYISRESCDEIKEISRLMPANLGDEHEVGPDEFVSELYALNRILSPNDSSLDRDMIEVMMEQRQQVVPGKERSGAPELPAKERESARPTRKDEEWMNLPDRI
ncbi:hypothetical protein [Methanoregula sp.]|uniref:hypothetical protein n=1 Tax=Methanoregula sp. TaxID=2052170 RepID=UPI002C0C7E29|nr:hypothetical protein [Methanoregula sp.]HVP96167.1 hypothetical protein [Methanoregula sp.]